MKFSLLMSVYFKDKPKHFKAALTSILEQTLLPDEVIIVKDGPLSQEMIQILEEFKSNSTLPNVHILEQTTNKGLAEALRFGLNYCTHEWVARMDADDISDKNRFLKQIDFLKNNTHVDVLGCAVEEFRVSPGDLKRERRMPVNHEEIYKIAKLRSPVNHPTCIYRKSRVIEAGNYNTQSRLEDFWLFVRMLKKECIFHNLNECYYHFRVGDNLEMLNRRRGNLYAREDFHFAKLAYDIKFFTIIDFLRYVVVKVPLRLMPVSLLAIVYKFLLRSKSNN